MSRTNNSPFFLCVNKPKGISSASMLNKVKWRFGIKKVGYCGTLDPMATGVIIIAANAATKLISLVTNDTKKYEGMMQFGFTSPSYDSETETTVVVENPSVSQTQLDDVTSQFSGTISQIPPIYSAIKIEGKRAYKLARKGENIEMPSRKITIFDLQLKQIEKSEASFSVHCSKGTYIRSLVHDIGQSFSCGAIMTALTRTAVGSFSLDRAMPWSVVQDELAEWQEYTIPIEEVLKSLPCIEVDDEAFALLRNGGEISSILPDLMDGLSWISYNNRPAFLLEKDEDSVRYKAFLYGDGA